MKTRIFLMSLVFLFLISLISAQCTEVGSLNGTHYCDSDLEYQLLKDNGENCDNFFECFNQSCIDGLCQTRYANVSLNLTLRTGLIGDILNLIQGVECNPLNQSYLCVGKEAFLCGTNFVWESKGEIIGLCGVVEEEEKKSSGGGGGSSRGSFINIVVFSPINNITISTISFPLRVADSRDKAKYWQYSLNGGERVVFVPNTTFYPIAGENVLDIFAKEFVGARTEAQKTIIFKAIPPLDRRYCGDGVCQESESCDSCELDCGACPVIEEIFCGDNICDSDESSYTCPIDCVALERTDYTPVAIGVAAASIAVLGFVLYRRFFEQGVELLDIR